jgi:multidrug efflux pump subunit AcrB
MSAGAIVAIIAAVAVVVLVIGAITAMRRRQLRQRFGPEYDRVAGEMRSQRKADAELAERERRVRSLDIHPLDETIRVKYVAEWTAIQERFVDQPEEAVTQAGMLVTSVMKDRGYPTEDHDQIVADLSVEHAGTLDHYRAAHQISMQTEEGTAGTENLRLAMLHYRALFSDLLGPTSETPQSGQPSAAATEPSPPGAAPGAGPATDTDTGPPVTAPRTTRPSS